MNKILPTMPISALRNNQSKIIDELEMSPKLLTNNGYEAAVLVSPTRWNEMVDLIARLEDSRIITQRSKEMDEDESSWMTADEVEAELIARGLLNGS